MKIGRLAIIGVLVLGILSAVLILLKQNEKTESPATLPQEKENVSLPENFPGYPNAKLLSSSKNLGESGAGTAFVWETDEKPASVSAFYKEALTAAGWGITAKIEREDFASFSITKEKTSGFVGIGKGERGKTVITVTLVAVVE